MVFEATPPSSALATLHHRFLSTLKTTSYPLPEPLPSLPLNPFTLVHATRLAFLYHDTLYRNHGGTTVGLFPRAKKGAGGAGAGGQVGYLQALFVIWANVFAGTTAAAVLQGQTAPMLLDPEAGLVASIYAGACVAMTGLYPLMTANPSVRRVFDAFFLIIDGFATSLGTITLGLTPLLSSAPNAASPLPSLVPLFLLPSLTGSLGSHLSPLLSLFSPSFTLSNPSYLTTLRSSPDVWGSWLLVVLYGGLADGRGALFGGVRDVLGVGFPATKRGREGALVGHDEAHAVCSLVLSTIFLLNEFGPAFLASTPLALTSSSTSPLTSTKKKLIKKKPTQPAVLSPNGDEATVAQPFGVGEPGEKVLERGTVVAKRPAPASEVDSVGTASAGEAPQSPVKRKRGRPPKSAKAQQ